MHFVPLNSINGPSKELIEFIVLYRFYQLKEFLRCALGPNTYIEAPGQHQQIQKRNLLFPNMAEMLRTAFISLCQMASEADVCVGQDWPRYRIQGLHLAEYQQVSTLPGHFSIPLFSPLTPLDIGFHNCWCDVSVTSRPPIWLTLQCLCTPIPHQCRCDSFVLLSLPLNVLLRTHKAAAAALQALSQSLWNRTGHLQPTQLSPDTNVNFPK